MNYTFRDAKIPLLLSPISGAPDPLTVEYIICSLLKPGTSAFAVFEIGQGSDTVPADFLSVGEGIYTLKVPGIVLTTFGEYLLKVEIIDDPLTRVVLGSYIFDLSIAESDRRSAAVPSNETCLIVGNVKAIDGRIPKWNDIEVSYRPVVFPQINNNVALTADTISTRTDIDGHFEMPCVRGALVAFEIPKCGIRLQYNVPYDLDTVNIIDVFNAMINS